MYDVSQIWIKKALASDSSRRIHSEALHFCKG